MSHPSFTLYGYGQHSIRPESEEFPIFWTLPLESHRFENQSGTVDLMTCWMTSDLVEVILERWFRGCQPMEQWLPMEEGWTWTNSFQAVAPCSNLTPIAAPVQHSSSSNSRWVERCHSHIVTCHITIIGGHLTTRSFCQHKKRWLSIMLEWESMIINRTKYNPPRIFEAT